MTRNNRSKDRARKLSQERGIPYTAARRELRESQLAGHEETLSVIRSTVARLSGVEPLLEVLDVESGHLTIHDVSSTPWHDLIVKDLIHTCLTEALGVPCAVDWYGKDLYVGNPEEGSSAAFWARANWLIWAWGQALTEGYVNTPTVLRKYGKVFHLEVESDRARDLGRRTVELHVDAFLTRMGQPLKQLIAAQKQLSSALGRDAAIVTPWVDQQGRRHPNAFRLVHSPQGLSFASPRRLVAQGAYTPVDPQLIIVSALLDEALRACGLSTMTVLSGEATPIQHGTSWTLSAHLPAGVIASDYQGKSDRICSTLMVDQIKVEADASGFARVTMF